MKVRNCILFACIICLCFSIYGVLDNKVNAEESVYPMWYKIFTKHNSTFTPTLVDDFEVKWNEEYKAVELISKESGSICPGTLISTIMVLTIHPVILMELH